MPLEVECLKYGTCSSYFCLSSKFTFFHMVHLLRVKTKFLKHEPYNSKLVSSPTKKIWLRFTTTMEFSKWYLWFCNLPIFLIERKKKSFVKYIVYDPNWIQSCSHRYWCKLWANSFLSRGNHVKYSRNLWRLSNALYSYIYGSMHVTCILIMASDSKSQNAFHTQSLKDEKGSFESA